MAPPELIRRVESRQEIKHQRHGLGRHQEVDHGSDHDQGQQQPEFFVGVSHSFSIGPWCLSPSILKNFQAENRPSLPMLEQRKKHSKLPR